jgi:hypothetical protein
MFYIADKDKEKIPVIDKPVTPEVGYNPFVRLK